MQGLALGGAGFGASSYLRSRHSLPPLPPSGQLGGMIPPTSVLSEQKLALASFMPELTDPGARNVPLIVNSLIEGAGGRRRIGAPGLSAMCGLRRAPSITSEVMEPRSVSS